MIQVAFVSMRHLSVSAYSDGICLHFNPLYAKIMHQG